MLLQNHFALQYLIETWQDLQFVISRALPSFCSSITGPETLQTPDKAGENEVDYPCPPETEQTAFWEREEAAKEDLKA